MKYDPILCMIVDDSVKTEDAMFVQLKFGSGRTEGAKLEENEYREYAEALLKKYGEKRVTLSKQGKVIVTYTNPNDSKTIDHAIRSCDSREDDIADELFDALQQIGKRNINKNEAEFISEKFFDGKVNADELMRIFNKYKKEYL